MCQAKNKGLYIGHSGINDSSEGGFTLVELMVTLVISSIIVMALYSAYILQQRSYYTQDQVVEMQQNLRAGITSMITELRLAGYDPEGNSKATIVAAYHDAFVFTADLNEDGCILCATGTVDSSLCDSSCPGTSSENEWMGFDRYTASDGVMSLGRSVASSAMLTTTDKGTPGAPHYENLNHRPIADNIENIEFFYLFEDGTSSTTTPATTKYQDIRAVRVSLLARSAIPDRKYTNTDTYTTASGVVWDPVDDNYRRRLLITQVDLRNMGL